jgi:hypothetical protein
MVLGGTAIAGRGFNRIAMNAMINKTLLTDNLL